MLGFWFSTLEPKHRFARSAALDVAIGLGFHQIYQQVASAAGDGAEALAEDAETGIAAIVALDQLPRNMFRGTPHAFATDPLALALAESMVARGHDKRLTAEQRHFCYLPFEHSERLADQQRAVELISAMGDAVLTRYAVAHEVIIRRFGRFPHRNAILGRTSTPEELQFLTEPGSSF